jgi:transcriptional regulator with XRE-family HTH domain
MDVSLLIRQRLKELALEQKDLARAASVTESYISQLLTGKRAPPWPNRTDIYDKMDRVLKLPKGELARLAVMQRKEELKRELGQESQPLFQEVRELVLRKCAPRKANHVRAIFEKQAFGELERLVTQKLLDVVKRMSKSRLHDDEWLRRVAKLSGLDYEELRVIVLEFLDTDIFDVSIEHCDSFLDPLIESWDIDLATFSLEIVLNRSVVAAQVKRFEFTEEAPEPLFEEPGLTEFLADRSLRGTATDAEIAFLKKFTFKNRRPTALYYYRELQNLRDPLHFGATSAPDGG